MPEKKTYLLLESMHWYNMRSIIYSALFLYSNGNKQTRHLTDQPAHLTNCLKVMS